MKIRMFSFVSFLIILFLATNSHAGSLKISKDDFGEQWPFSVSEGTLSCTAPSTVTFKANGVKYAVNGIARGAGYADIIPIWIEDEKIRKDLQKAFPDQKIDDMVPNVNIGPIIQKGLSLCK